MTLEPSSMPFERRVVKAFGKLKAAGNAAPAIEGSSKRGLTVQLLPFDQSMPEDAAMIALLTRWRQENIAGFTKVFRVTEGGTQSWSRSQLIDRQDRILFLVREPGRPFVGHVGLSSFDFPNGTCEIDNIVRGDVSAPKGTMQAAIEVLLDWAYGTLAPREVQLRALHDNTRALAMYHRLGFAPFALHPLKIIEGADFTEWVPAEPTEAIARFLLAMRHERARPASLDRQRRE